MSLQDVLFAFSQKVRVWDLWRAINPSQLTVLNYHRICSPDDPWALFKPNISATPKSFAAQLDYLEQHFTVISTQQLADWIRGQGILPKHAALITFDDGYADNFHNAYPELQRRGLPAIIFLTTGFMDGGKPFYWDLLAYSLQQTEHMLLQHPALGKFTWNDAADRDRVTLRVVEALKKLPESEKLGVVNQIVDALAVKIPAEAFSGLSLEWDQVREMAKNGLEIGAHTVSHPILTRISIEEAEEEIRESKTRIESEIGKKVIAFAYPNGQGGDFNPEIQAQLAANDYCLGFALMPGPHSYRYLGGGRYEIRRVFLSHRDDMNRFVAKLYGMPRLFEFFGKGMG